MAIIDINLFEMVKFDNNLIFFDAWKYETKTINTELLMIGNNPSGISH